MSTKDLLKEKINNQIRAWEQKLEEEKAEAEKEKAQAASDEAATKINEKMLDRVKSLQKQIGEAQDTLKEVTGAATDKLDGLKKKVDNLTSSSASTGASPGGAP